MNLSRLVGLVLFSLPLGVFADWHTPLFTGWQPYVGVGGGAEFFDQASTITGTVDGTTGSQRSYPLYFSNRHTGAVLNAFAGVSNTWNNHVYTGLELGFYYNPATYTSSINYISSPAFSGGAGLNEENYMTGSIPLRLDLAGIFGYKLDQHWMPYGRLGLDAAQLNTTYTIYQTGGGAVGTPITGSTTLRNYLFGGTIGLGARYYFTQHWFVAAEGDYTRFLNLNDSGPSWFLTSQDRPFIVSGTDYNYHFQTSLWSAIASVGYQF